MTMLVHGRWVIPDADGAVIDNGAVLVEGGRIAALGSFDELAAQHPEAGIFGGERYAVMPGLIAPLVVWPAANDGIPEPTRLIAALIAFAIGMWFRSVIGAVFGGMITLYALQFLLG